MSNPNSNKGGCLIWFIVFAIIAPLLWLCLYLEDKFPAKSSYEEVQSYRNNQDYYISNGEEWVEDVYGEEAKTFLSEDVEDAYNAGLRDGIEQTIEYYEKD